MEKTLVNLRVPVALRDAVHEVARRRTFETKRRITMTSMIIAALLADPDVEKEYLTNIKGNKGKSA